MDMSPSAEQLDSIEIITDVTRVVYPPFTHPESQIRLLQVSGQGDSLTCVSRVFDRDSAPAYEAISYTWGERDLSAIEVNGIPTNVRKNCQNALEMRQHCNDAAQWTWIDSLCIKQDDLAEKSQQVRSIGSIFNQAERVLAMLKSSASKIRNIPCLLHYVQHAAALMKQEPQICRSNVMYEPEPCEERVSCWIASLVNSQKFPLSDLFTAMRLIGEDPYWRRLWVFQELKLARKKVMMLGDNEIEWEGYRMLFNVVNGVMRVLYDFDPESSRLVFKETALDRLCSVKNSQEIASALSPTIFTRSCLYAGSIVAMVIETSSDCERPEFYQLAPWLPVLECSDSRDRIFGLVEAVKWSASDRTPIVDYTKTPLELAIHVVDITETNRPPPIGFGITNVFSSLRVEANGYDAAGMSSLLKTRRSSYRLSESKSVGSNGQCLCVQVETGRLLTLRMLSIQATVKVVNGLHHEVLMLDTSREIMPLRLAAGKTQNSATYFCSVDERSRSNSTNIRAIFGGSIRDGDLVVQLTREMETSIPSDDRCYPYLVVRPWSPILYAIVGCAVIQEAHRESPKVFEENREEHSQKLKLVAHPEDYVLFHLLYCGGRRVYWHNDNLIRQLYRALSDSFCRIRFSSFLMPANFFSADWKVPAVCADCGGTRDGEGANRI